MDYVTVHASGNCGYDHVHTFHDFENNKILVFKGYCNLDIEFVTKHYRAIGASRV